MKNDDKRNDLKGLGGEEDIIGVEMLERGGGRLWRDDEVCNEQTRDAFPR